MSGQRQINQERERRIAEALSTPEGRRKLADDMDWMPRRAMFPPAGTFLDASKRLMDEMGCVVIEEVEEPMVVCHNCGAIDGEAYDIYMTIAAKWGKIWNISCTRCGMRELHLADDMGCVVIEEEWVGEGTDAKQN